MNGSETRVPSGYSPKLSVVSVSRPGWVNGRRERSTGRNGQGLSGSGRDSWRQGRGRESVGDDGSGRSREVAAAKHGDSWDGLRRTVAAAGKMVRPVPTA
jgi:hypothetical protein